MRFHHQSCRSSKGSSCSVSSRHQKLWNYLQPHQHRYFSQCAGRTRSGNVWCAWQRRAARCCAHAATRYSVKPVQKTLCSIEARCALHAVRRQSATMLGPSASHMFHTRSRLMLMNQRPQSSASDAFKFRGSESVSTWIAGFCSVLIIVVWCIVKI